MHAKLDLRVRISKMIIGAGSVIVGVMRQTDHGRVRIKATRPTSLPPALGLLMLVG